MPRKQRGFTLTEAAIVLGIVGLILGAIWVAAAAVYNNLRVSTSSTQLLQIVQSVRSMHATQTAMTDTAGTDIAVTLAQAGAIPKDMLDKPTDPTTVTNVWGDSVTIAPAAAGDANGQVVVSGGAFTIVFESVPRAPCSDLLVRNTGAGRDSGLLEAGTTNGAVYDYNAGDGSANGGFPISASDAVAACADPDANDLTFTFALKT